MIYDIESRLVRTAADQLGIPVYDNILIIKVLIQYMYLIIRIE